MATITVSEAAKLVSISGQINRPGCATSPCPICGDKEGKCIIKKVQPPPRPHLRVFNLITIIEVHGGVEYPKDLLKDNPGC